jgi:hypothetical protein
MSAWLSRLIQKGVVDSTQVAEAKRHAAERGIDVGDALIQLGYAPMGEILAAKAAEYGVSWVDLDSYEIPAAVIELVPESVARENGILPLNEGEDGLVFAVADPNDIDTLEKLRFILNRPIRVRLAGQDQIRHAINRYYGAEREQEVQVLDWRLADQLPDNLILGNAFLFVDLPDPSSDKPVNSLFAASAGRKVVSRLAGDLSLPGVLIAKTQLPQLRLRSITSDKSLYRSGSDVVHLLVVDLAARSCERNVRICLNYGEHGRRSVRLDEQGCGTLELRGLEPGDYCIEWIDESDDAPRCTFTVAEYQLAPLTARLVERSVSADGKLITVRMRLDSFASPAQGSFSIELSDRGRPVHAVESLAQGGLVEVTLELRGRGPHEINVASVRNPSLTASIGLAGSRLEERSPIVFSHFGHVIAGSLIPHDHIPPIRGLHFHAEGETASPVRLESVGTSRVRLEIVAELEALHVALVDPGNETTPLVVERASAEPGEVIELEPRAALSWLIVGGFVGGKSWEGMAAILRPSKLSLSLTSPHKLRPGEPLAVEIDVSGEAAAALYVVVKDARLTTNDSPSSVLAGRLKQGVEAAKIGTAFVAQKLRLACFASSSSADSILMEFTDTAIDFTETTAVLANRSMPFAGAASEPPRRPGETADTVFAGFVPVTQGRATLALTSSQCLTEYVVEAYAFRGDDWAVAETHFVVAKDAFVELQMPSLVHSADKPIGTLHVGARAPARVELRRNGELLPLWHEGREQPASQPFASGEWSFEAVPGQYVATLFDARNNMLDAVSGRIEPLGKLRGTTRSIRFLQSGERISPCDDVNIVSLRVLPSLDRPFHALCDATADYAHCCCEQTAAKIVAGCAMYRFGKLDDWQRRKGEEIILLGIERERQMWLRGRGFKAYPDSDNVPCDWLSEMAAAHLRSLGLLDAVAMSDSLRQAVLCGLEMASDVQGARQVPWPPEAIGHNGDAYAAVRFGVDPVANRRALEHVRHGGKKQGHAKSMRELLSGAVGKRVELAYAAATLFRGGESEDVLTALEMANRVVADFGADGRLYSTADSVAAIALLSELESRRLLSAGQALVDEDGSIESLQGTVAVEVVRISEEDWEQPGDDVRVVASIERNGGPRRRLVVGDAVELIVSLPDGYQVGDLALICLPASLCRIQGGGQVKRFACDFAGRNQLRIPLSATGVTTRISGEMASQHIVVRMRNMYQEERTGTATLAVTAGRCSGPSDSPNL